MKIEPVTLQEMMVFLSSSGVRAELRGENVTISGISSVTHCQAGDITFASSVEFLKTAASGPATAVVMADKLSGDSGNKPCIVVENVNLSHALLKKQYADWNFHDTEEWGRVHPSAVIHSEAVVDDTAVIGPQVVIGRAVQLHRNTVVMAGSVIEAGVIIQENTVIHSNVTIGKGSQIGKDCIIRSGSIIGSEGFGFAQDAERHHHRIPQTGIVVIEDRCVIGAGNCIDRAAYDITRIRSGTITDNLCHIAHNCDIGEDTILLAQTGIAGSSVLGKRVICSGQTGVIDHITIPDDTVLVARAAVLEDIETSGVYAGVPLQPLTSYHRSNLHIRNLPQLSRDLKAIQKKVDALGDS